MSQYSSPGIYTIETNFSTYYPKNINRRRKLWRIIVSIDPCFSEKYSIEQSIW